MVLDNKSFAQKTLVVYGLCYVFYGATFMGETLGLEDAGAKYQGKKSGPVGWSAAQWAGIGAIVCGLDCLFVAFKTGEQTAMRTIAVNCFASFMRLGIFAAHGSTQWGGVTVHKEFLQGGAITTTFLMVGLYNLNGSMKAVKNVFKVPSLADLTHAGLLVQFTLFFFYIMSFIWTDFPGANYMCKGGCRSEGGVYEMMAWTVSMWTQVTLTILAVMQTATNAEKMEFAKMRALTVLVQIWQMEQPAEKAVAVPEKLMENKIAMGISVLSCLVAGFSDKLKGNAKPTKSTTRSKRR
jgi:hypothetical protein